jgi:hypothetical protein
LEDFVGEKRKEFGGFTNHHNISYSVKISFETPVKLANMAAI